MKISIITPVYNDKRIGRALDSILMQRTKAQLELIVIDGGSRDGTLDIINYYRRHLAVFVSERDSGTVEAMNKGIAAATGDVVGFLNADDRYSDANVVHEIAEAFADPKVEGCYGDAVFLDRTGRIIRYWQSGEYRARHFYLGWMPAATTFYVRNIVYKSYGGFDPWLKLIPDYELMLRFIVKHKINLRYIPRIMVTMDIGGMSNRAPLRNLSRSISEAYLSWRRNSLPFGFAAPLLRPTRKVLQFVRRPAEFSYIQEDSSLND